MFTYMIIVNNEKVIMSRKYYKTDTLNQTCVTISIENELISQYQYSCTNIEQKSQR